MNILLLTDYYPPDKIGGVGEIARQLAVAYRGMGHTVTVLTTGRARGDEAAAGIVRSTPGLVRGVFLNNLVAWRLLRRERIDFVHLHQSGTTLFLIPARWLACRPVVASSLQVSYISEAREIRTISVGGVRVRPRAAGLRGISPQRSCHRGE
jgi:hypothetical protein